MRFIGRMVLMGWTLCFSPFAWSETEGETKSWNTAIVTGPFAYHGKIRYYVQTQVNFVDDKYKFQNVSFFVGAGYLFNPTVTVWLLGGNNYSKRSNGHIRHITTLRQQMDWRLMNTPDLLFTNTSRLEERKDSTEVGWAVRIRERLTMRIPFKNWAGHSLIVFDEVFFDLNHPAWINSNTFLEENRAFIGIGSVLSKHVNLDVGYVNQYEMRDKNTMANILYVVLNVALV